MSKKNYVVMVLEQICMKILMFQIMVHQEQDQY